MKFITRNLVLALAALFLAATAAAQPNVAFISYDLTVIDASGTKGDPEVDPKLDDIKDALLDATKFKKFKLISSTPYRNAAVNRRKDAALPRGYTCVMVPQAKVVKQGKNFVVITAVQVQIIHNNNKKKPLLNVTVLLKQGKPNFVEFRLAKDHSIILCFIGR
jgi:hypothetical protein